MALRSSTSEFVSKARQIFGDRFDYSKVEYLNNSTKVQLDCRTCGRTFEVRPNDHLSSRTGCPFCARCARRTPESFISDARRIHGDVYDYSLVSEVINTYTKISILHPKCGQIFQMSPNTHTSQGSGCPHCKTSEGEKLVASLLEDLGLTFQRQAALEGLKLKRQLRVDFWLPAQRVVIEYDGVDHFRPNRRSSLETEEQIRIRFEQTQARDKAKTDYCLRNQIQLLRINSQTDIRKTLNNHFSKETL